jgi:hypothetical protein
VLEGSNEVVLEADGAALVAGENRFTAYAFNRDNVKSSDATLNVTGADSLKRAGAFYVLAVGVNLYANADYNLRYAVADAQSFDEEVRLQQESLKRYARVEIVPLYDREATKADVLGALARLAEKAQPEDTVVFFAGHGTAHEKRFYLIPHDLGYTGARDSLDRAGLGAIRSGRTEQRYEKFHRRRSPGIPQNSFPPHF